MKRALITGINGFVGSHLAELLLGLDYDIYGTTLLGTSSENLKNAKDNVKLIPIDLRDREAVLKILKDVEPDCIFHLAAKSFVPDSWADPRDTFENNVFSTINILEACRFVKNDPKIQMCGSSEEYGEVRESEVPIKESSPLRPLSPYAVTKVAQDMLGLQYHASYGLKTIRTRAFNHTGPRRPDFFATSTFAKQLASIKLNLQEPFVYHGNLSTYRDFTDVRDVVRAYELALRKCKSGEVYNICSGEAYRIGDVLNILFDVSEVRASQKLDERRLRPSDPLILKGDCSKFMEATGWKREIPIEKTLSDLYDYWLDILSGTAVQKINVKN